MQGKRYSNEKKQEILEFLKEHTYYETENRFNVSQTTLARWSKELSTNTQKKLLSKIEPCLKMLKLIEGVRNISLIGVGGYPIVFNPESNWDETRIGAMTAAIVSLSERVGIECEHGGLKSTIIDSTKGIIICIGAGKAAILTIAFYDTVDLKHIINHSFYYIDRIREIIGTLVH
ncbi:MAG: roadblock/LC7 domain-containing protein [Candidatus Hodarchaeales archaeon]|jgi:predicted regulator of Ras-like GTPase activity (Roadblock/LC7/MglB family)